MTLVQTTSDAPQVVQPGNDVPIRFESSAQFRARPSYTQELRCTSDQLDRIIGKYEFTEAQAVSCGLNGCHRKHWHGYVIRTTDGRETNIGQDCGRREFAVVFAEVEAAYRASEDRHARATYIADLLSRKGALLSRSLELERIAAMHVREVKDILQILTKESAIRKAFETAKRLRGRISRFRPATEAERISMGKEGRKEHAEIEETLGVLEGLACVDSVDTVLSVIKFKALIPLEGIKDEALPSMTEQQLLSAGTSVKDVRSTIDEAERFCRDSIAFCSPRNRLALSRLAEVINRKHRTARTVRLMRHLAGQDQQSDPEEASASGA